MATCAEYVTVMMAAQWMLAGQQMRHLKQSPSYYHRVSTSSQTEDSEGEGETVWLNQTRRGQFALRGFENGWDAQEGPYVFPHAK